MMMQIVRRESAVAQGLRSDTLLATKKAECASMRPLPFPPLACWLRTSPESQPASLPDPPKSLIYLAEHLPHVNYFQFLLNSVTLCRFYN